MRVRSGACVCRLATFVCGRGVYVWRHGMLRMSDSEFVNEFKHFSIFEELMNSEILEEIEINDSFLGDNTSDLLNLSHRFHFKQGSNFLRSRP